MDSRSIKTTLLFWYTIYSQRKAVSKYRSNKYDDVECFHEKKKMCVF